MDEPSQIITEERAVCPKCRGCFSRVYRTEKIRRESDLRKQYRECRSAGCGHRFTTIHRYK